FTVDCQLMALRASRAHWAPLMDRRGGSRMRLLLTNPATALAIAYIAVVSLLAVSAPFLALPDAAFQDYAAVFAPPTPDHLLGADHLGRDTLSRLIHGARTSLGVGLFAQCIVVAIGVPVGAFAGFRGGRTDAAIMRFVDVMFAFPDLLLIILLRSVFGGSVTMMFLAIGLVEWTALARLTRAQVRDLTHLEFVGAAVARGARPFALLRRH
ncbi:MAG: ABC transporter permease, partial [Chloroflexota bacterium]